MFIKIYFNEKAVYLCDALNSQLQEILHHPDAVFIDELSSAAIKSLLHEIEKPAFHAGVLLHTDLDALQKAFFKHFTTIEAAGGIVQNEAKDILFIYRLEKWDLPKGKIETGETPSIAAIREVEEETGATQLTLLQEVGKTYHTYHAYGKHFIKTTHWFHLTTRGEQYLKPQTEEDIAALEWASKNNLSIQMANTYPSIEDILQQFFEQQP